MPKSLRLVLLAILVGLLTAGVAFARAMQQGENCNVPADTVVQGSMFTFCQNLNIAGKIEGNLIGIGLRTTITGEVGKNVYLAGLELDLTGVVHGDLHYVGLMLNLASPDAAPHRPVLGQLIFAALSFTLDADAQALGPITGMGYQALLNGIVQGEVNYWGSAFVLNNLLRGDVYTSVGNPESDLSDVETLLLPLNIEFAPAVPGITITGSGHISGKLEYMGPAEAIINGSVAGDIEYYSTIPAFMPDIPQQGLATLYYDQFKRELAVLLTVGILGIVLVGRRFRYPLTHLRRRPVHSFVIGMLLFIISFPITLILLLATIVIVLLLLVLNLDGVAVPVGAFLALVDIGMIGTFYFCAIFVARAIFALGLGRVVLQAAGQTNARRMPRLSVIIGVALLALLTSLPVLGFLFNAGALFMGLGAIASTTMGWLRALGSGRLNRMSPAASDQNPGQGQRHAFDAEPAPLAHITPLLPAELGLDDLPIGFDPDFFFNDD